MAEAIGLAASILAIAGAGVSITSNLYGFARSYIGVDAKVEGIAASVSLTAAILTNLGNILEQNAQDIKKDNTEKMFRNSTSACKKDFERLNEALGRAKKEWKNGKDGKMEKMADITPWHKLKWAIGGEEGIHDLMRSLENSKSNLQLLLDSLNYGILMKFKRENVLTPQTAEDLVDRTKKIRWIVQSLQQAGFEPNSIHSTSKEKIGNLKSSSDGQRAVSPDSSLLLPNLENPREEGTGSRSLAQQPPINVSQQLNLTSDEKSSESVIVSDIFSQASPQPFPRKFSRNIDDNKSGEEPPVARKSLSSTISSSTSSRLRAPLQTRHYEAYSLIYKEVWIIKRFLFKVAMISQRTPVKTYHIHQVRAPQVELAKAVNDGRSTSVLEILTSLPRLTQKAIADHIDTHKRRNPTIVALKVVKRSFLNRLTGLWSMPLVLFIVLEYEREMPAETERQTLVEYHHPQGFQRPQEFRRSREFQTRQDFQSPQEFQFQRQTSVSKVGHDSEMRLMTNKWEPLALKKPSALDSDASWQHQLRIDIARLRRDHNKLIGPHHLEGKLHHLEATSNSSRIIDREDQDDTVEHIGATVEPRPLPSEQEAVEMMEKFLAGFTTLYDDEKGGSASSEH